MRKLQKGALDKVSSLFNFNQASAKDVNEDKRFAGAKTDGMCQTCFT